MRDDVKVKVDLEAEDTLAVRLKSLRCAEGQRLKGPARECSNVRRAEFSTSRRASTGAFALLEVDGVSNAVLLRSPKPERGPVRSGRAAEWRTRSRSKRTVERRICRGRITKRCVRVFGELLG